MPKIEFQVHYRCFPSRSFLLTDSLKITVSVKRCPQPGLFPYESGYLIWQKKLDFCSVGNWLGGEKWAFRTRMDVIKGIGDVNWKVLNVLEQIITFWLHFVLNKIKRSEKSICLSENICLTSVHLPLCPSEKSLSVWISVCLSLRLYKNKYLSVHMKKTSVWKSVLVFPTV